METKRLKDNNQQQLWLVPVDFSPHSEHALLQACLLIKNLSAKILVLHVVHDPSEMPNYYSNYQADEKDNQSLMPIENRAQKIFESFISEMIKKNPTVKALKQLETKLVIGLPVSRIIEVAEKINASMIVMGSQGRTGLKRVMLGSKAEQVLRLCPMPITIVKMQLTE